MNKVMKNIFAGALPQIVNIISNMILPAMIIASFGSEINGLVSTTKVIISYVSIVGAGIATAATQSLYEPVAKNETETIKGMIKSTEKMFTKYGCIFILLAILVALVYPLIVHSNESYITIFLIIIVMSISGASEFFAVGRCRTLLYANQQVYVCSIAQAVSLMSSLIIAIIMIKAHFGIVAVQLSISSVYLFQAILLVTYVNKNFPQLKNYRISKERPEAVNKRGDALVHQVSGLAITGSQTLELSTIVGLVAASIYSVYNIVFVGLQLVCSSICTSITPFLGRSIALGNKASLNKMYNIIECLFFYVVCFIYSVSIIMILPFVKVYTLGSDINYIYPVLAILFVINSAFFTLKMPSTALINAAGHFKETKVRAIIEAVLCVVLGIILTIAIGINGVVIGSLIALGWRCFDTIIYSNKRILAFTNKRSFFRLVIIFLTIAVAGFIGFKFAFTVENFAQWCILAVKVSIIVFFVVLLEMVIFEREILMQIIGRFRVVK